jgi:hypothetical protein
MGIRATLGQLEVTAVLVPPGTLAQLVPQVLKDRPELQVRPDARGQPVIMEPLEELVPQVRRAMTAKPDRPDLKVLMEKLVKLEEWVPQVLKARRVTEVTLGQQAFRAPRAKRDRQDHRGPRVIQAPRARKE